MAKDERGATTREPSRDVDRESTALSRTQAYFDRHNAGTVTLVAALTVVFVAVLDAVTGPNLTFSFFYLVPVALVAWRLGRGWGTVAAALTTIAWFVADAVQHEGASGHVIPYWNAAVRFGSLVVVAVLVAQLREVLRRQRVVAEREAEAAEGLRALNDLKDTLLHAVSHDLKAPAAAIIGSVSTLRRRDQLQLTADQLSDLLEGIDVSARKIDRLVNDLLDLERLERGVVEPERTPTDIQAVANDVVKDTPDLARHPVRVDADPVLVDVDTAKVERIMENLLLNAARHTPIGTPVLVGVRAVKDGVLVTVADEGPGVPDELKPVIFEAFRQGQGTRGGVGIGLSLVARFAELHGGAAWVEDRPGGGTVFSVHLPGEVSFPVAEGRRPAPEPVRR